MLTRRKFLMVSAVTGSAMLLPWKGNIASALAAPIAGGTLAPNDIMKYQLPLIIPPAMPRTGKVTQKGAKSIEYYEIAVRQFQQQILPLNMPMTTVWSYGSANLPNTFNYPAFTIEAKANKPVRVKWINDLKDTNGNYLPHLLPVDPTLHWANPPGPIDTRPIFTNTPGPYTGPVPIVTHVHGAHTLPESDGYPEAWWLPAAKNLGAVTRKGTHYASPSGTPNDFAQGFAVFDYPNDQAATTLWYHDHTLGMTRLNVYAGPAGFYIVRGGMTDLPTGTLPGPAPAHGDPPGLTYYEIPIAIQDRSFNADGSLFFPDTREFFDEFSGPYIPDSDISPIWNPEFFGNTMVVNGRTWPFMEVEQRRYRFRFLNGCNARFLILQFSDPGLTFWQIGAEGGFLPAPVQLNQLLIAPAERADVIVDFTSVPVGTEVILLNLGPDEPFGGGAPGIDFDPSDPGTTGQVMQFRVGPALSADTSTPPHLLTLPPFNALGAESNTRQVSLNEEDSAELDEVGPKAALLGTLNSNGTGNPLLWMDTISESPLLNSTEVWEIHNFTADAHPIHIHLVQFQVVNRQPMDGAVRAPEAWETGYKDTVIAYPGEITRVKARFDIRGLYVWHCHIVDHEDNEMMRPYQVV